MVPHPADALIAARSAIAAAYLGALPPAQLGDVILRDDQRRIVARAQHAIETHGGCLIAEDVGRGKTFVALALARRWLRPLVIVPAGLRTTWREASARAGVPVTLASHESLSRGRAVDVDFDVLIVDESHHFRTMRTRRHAALALLAARAPVVLLSATPLQNRTRDLAAQIALFIGERAFDLEAAALSRFVIRGSAAPLDAMPTVTPPAWITIHADDGATLEAILALPPPPRPLDGGDAGALRTIGLVRAWSSSRAALTATLRTRDRLATAIAQGVDAGRAPTRQEARAWHAAEGVVQLGFSSLLMAATPHATELTALGAALDEDRRAMDALSVALRTTPNPDVARVQALRALREAHPDRRIIAFSEYASTIAAFHSAMRGDAGVGMLTAREARIATGRISRDEMLARFAPVAQRASAREAHQSVTLLLATDLLSEGVNLQDASVVVHLDLPWNPARLAQRVGRVRRIGGSAEVLTFVLAPPARATALIDADARLRRKLVHAEQVVGAQFPVLPSLSQSGTAPLTPTHSASAEGELVSLLTSWLPPPSNVPRSIAVAAVESAASGWLCAFADGRLLARIGEAAPDETTSALSAAEASNGEARRVCEEELHVAMMSIDALLAAESIASSCGVGESSGPTRRGIERLLAEALATLPRHIRGVALPLMAQLRHCLRSTLPLGAERLMLEALASSAADGSVAALSRAVNVGVASRAFRCDAPNGESQPSLRALILLGASSQR